MVNHMKANVSNANKKVKVGQDEAKFGSDHEKEGECSNEKASGSSNDLRRLVRVPIRGKQMETKKLDLGK